MAERKATARWEGALKEGSGTVALGSGAYEGGYSFSSRFEEGGGTNPEELIAAAQAGCFSMALSLSLEQAGHTPESVETTASVRLSPADGGGFEISRIALVTRARVDGIDADEFARHAEETKTGCIVSKALAAVPEVTLDAALEG